MLCVRVHPCKPACESTHTFLCPRHFLTILLQQTEEGTKRGQTVWVVLMLLINNLHTGFMSIGHVGLCQDFSIEGATTAEPSLAQCQHGENSQALVTFAKQINSLRWNSTLLDATVTRQPLDQTHTRHVELLCHIKLKALFPYPPTTTRKRVIYEITQSHFSCDQIFSWEK